jgi:hypothetical protein
VTAKTRPAAGAADQHSAAPWERVLLLVQLLGTVAALGWVPGDWAKLAAMLPLWAIGFRRVSRAELALMVVVDMVFVLADGGALRKHVFRFTHPDLLGLPIYEFLMWGFYTLHAIRFIGGRCPRLTIPTVILAAIFAAAFSTIGDANRLLLVSAAVLALALLCHHERDDLRYAGYMIVVGALVEYVGTGTGQWAYPAAPHGGVPAWFVTMWGGVGLFTRRLFLPLLINLRRIAAGFAARQERKGECRKN